MPVLKRKSQNFFQNSCENSIYVNPQSLLYPEGKLALAPLTPTPPRFSYDLDNLQTHT